MHFVAVPLLAGALVPDSGVGIRTAAVKAIRRVVVFVLGHPKVSGNVHLGRDCRRINDPQFLIEKSRLLREDDHTVEDVSKPLLTQALTELAQERPVGDVIVQGSLKEGTEE